MIKKILGWIFIPYVMIGIIISKKTNSKIAGLIVGFMFFLLIYSIAAPEKEKTIINKPESSTIKKIETTKTPQKKQDNEIKEIEEAPIKKSIESKKTPAKKKDNNRLTIDVAVSILKKSYDGIATIEKDNEIIRITCNDKSFIYEVMAAKNGDKQKEREWEKIEENLKETSRNIDASITIVIVNPENTNNLLLVITDGITIYNYVTE